MVTNECTILLIKKEQLFSFIFTFSLLCFVVFKKIHCCSFRPEPSAVFSQQRTSRVRRPHYGGWELVHDFLLVFARIFCPQERNGLSLQADVQCYQLVEENNPPKVPVFLLRGKSVCKGNQNNSCTNRTRKFSWGSWNDSVCTAIAVLQISLILRIQEENICFSSLQICGSQSEQISEVEPSFGVNWRWFCCFLGYLLLYRSSPARWTTD